MRGHHAAVMIQQTRATLQGWLQREMSPLARAKRARAMMLLEQGHSYAYTARRVGLTERNLRKWAKRFHNRGVAGLDDSPRPGRAPVFPNSSVLQANRCEFGWRLTPASCATLCQCIVPG